MRIIYVLSVILLGVGFFSLKKTNEKLNAIKWSIIFIIALMGYNITVCMILGLLNITAHLLLLSLINVGFGILLGYKAIKNKDYQKYFVRKQDIAGLGIVLAIFGWILIRHIRPQDGGIKYAAVDAAIHYRAAKHFSDNLKIFINCEDKTIFNFNVMQTGAYINDGLLMNVLNGLFKIPEYYVYEIFEISILLLTSLAFYILIMDKIKGKMGFFLTMLLMWLYMFAYPYNSYMYGFSYLSVGVMFIVGLISVVQMLYDETKINRIIVYILTSLIAMGIIFSYCLFVPGAFAATCIYIFIKDLVSDEKKYLKIFGKTTLILTGILLAITVVGILYLFLPTFFIADQSNLVEALKNPGGMYSNLYSNFLFYIAFGILYIVDLVQQIKKKEYEFNFLDGFTWVFFSYFAVVWIAMRCGFVSPYYFYKIYYILWPCVLAITINLVNKYCSEKYFKIAIPVYECAWVLFVCTIIILKSGNILDFDTRTRIPNYIGIYFDQNYNYRGLIQAYNNLGVDQIETIKKLRDIDDIKAENVLFITGSNYERAWALAISEITADEIKYNKIIENPTRYYLADGLNFEDIKYIVKIGMTDGTEDMDEYYEMYPNLNEFEVLHKSKRCYIVRKY